MVRPGNAQEVGELLKQGLPPNLCNHKGDSLLMLASYHGHPDTARALLAHGARMDARDAKGMSALDAARAMGAPDTPTQLDKHLS